MSTAANAQGARARIIGTLVQKKSLQAPNGRVGMRILINVGKAFPVAAYVWDNALVAKLLPMQTGERLHLRCELAPYMWTARNGSCDGFALRLKIASVARFSGKENAE